MTPTLPSRAVVTTSWDDGERYDLRLAELLRSRNIAATFYVPVMPYLGRPSLSHNDLRGLSDEGFEIGAHGFSHKHLWKLSAEELESEVTPCKPFLEDVLGAEVSMFCYPRGRYDSNAIRALEKAGYRGGRTVQMLATEIDFQPFEMPTTIQVAPTPRSSYMKNFARSHKIRRLPTLLSNMQVLGDWFELGKALFDSVLECGGIWHLYGHSQEIEQLGLWEKLEEILDYVCHRENVIYLTNGSLIRDLSSLVSKTTVNDHENHRCS